MMTMTESTFTSWDGTVLFYRYWLPEQPTDKALVLFHRGHEHSGRWRETVEALALDDCAIFAWDQRGHGQSPGERGSAENLGVVIKDAEAFTRHILAEHRISYENMIVVAHSVGAVIAAAWVHDFAPPLRGLILGAPAFRVKLYVPFAIPLLRLKQALFGPGYVKSYVKARMLTHDREQADAYAADPAIFRQIAVNILLDLYDTSTRLLADAGAITVPTLMLAAGADWVVSIPAQTEFYRKLSSPFKQLELLPGFYHAIFHEKNRSLLIDKIRRFVADRFAVPAATASLAHADQSGYTRTEYDCLRCPGGPVWPAVRCAMKTVGRMSRGISLGWKAGFDSGVMLDYIYENRPQGLTRLGTYFDRQYLESIGWRGIRRRRAHLEQMLRSVIAQTHGSGKSVRILDIASGPGRYVLETLHALADVPATAVLRDYKQENLDAARALAKQLGLADRVEIVAGDAFDRSSLAAVSPRPTIAIVSGLYELFPDNAGVMESLGGLADAVEPGGHLIYTNQPWHPQVEFIARTLTNREGEPWIMRRRTQQEMDGLVRAAGFEKIAQEIDQWGIFTVSLARRVSS